MLTLNQQKFTCHHCGKGYTRKNSHYKHVLLCDVIHTSTRQLVCDEEESTDIPTIRQLYFIIQEMAVKYNKLEKKMEEMQKAVPVKKKKLVIN